jgi:hypothetical protein
MSTSKLPAHRLRRVAVAADVDPRAVARVVAGLSTRPAMYERIVAALRTEAPDVDVPPPPISAPRGAQGR